MHILDGYLKPEVWATFDLISVPAAGYLSTKMRRGDHDSRIPLLGVIPGVIYYRLSIITGLRGYTPPLRGCLLRIFVRIVDWMLILLQPIPILGALIIPTMCLMSFWIYRASLRGRAESDFADLAAKMQQA